MKKKYSLILFLLFLGSLTYGQALEEIETRIAKENGIKQKTRIDYKYSNGSVSKTGEKTGRTLYNRSGDILRVEYLNNKGVVTSFERYEYDERGNRTLYERSGSSKYKKETKYNSNNQIVLEVGFNGVENFRNEYSYDSQGNLQEIIYKVGTQIQQKMVYDVSGNTTWGSVYLGGSSLTSKTKIVHDSRGNVIEETSYGVDGKETEKKTYSYNSENKLLEEQKKVGSNLIYKITHTYTSSGDLKQVSEESSSKAKFAKKVYEYDSAGNLSHYKWRRKPDDEFNVKTYTYNNQGICLSEHTFYPSSKFELLTRFEYDFY